MSIEYISAEKYSECNTQVPLVGGRWWTEALQWCSYILSWASLWTESRRFKE